MNVNEGGTHSYLGFKGLKKSKKESPKVYKEGKYMITHRDYFTSSFTCVIYAGERRGKVVPGLKNEAMKAYRESGDKDPRVFSFK